MCNSKNHRIVIYPNISEENMYRIISDLFLAGTETTSAGLDWVFLFMSEFPEVQEKCQEEINKVRAEQLTAKATNKTLIFSITGTSIQYITSIFVCKTVWNIFSETLFISFDQNWYNEIVTWRFLYHASIMTTENFVFRFILKTRGVCSKFING